MELRWGGSCLLHREVYMYDKFGEISQYNFELLRVKMSTSTIVSLLAVLGVLVGLGNPAGLGGCLLYTSPSPRD